MLEDPEEKKRAAAAAAAKPGAKPRPPQKPSDRFLVRRAAAEWCVGAIGEPPPPGGKSWQDLALDDMGQCLTISDTYTGFFLRPVLVSIGAPAVPMLAEGLKSQKTWDRAAAVLAEMNNPIRSGSDSDFRRPHFAKPWKDEQRLRKVDAKTKAALVAAVPDLIALVGSNQASGSWAAEVLGAVVDDANRQAAIDAMVERIRRGSGDPGALRPDRDRRPREGGAGRPGAGHAKAGRRQGRPAVAARDRRRRRGPAPPPPRCAAVRPRTARPRPARWPTADRPASPR